METALITGASSGIGKEFARIFAKNGINVILIARNESALISLKEELTSNYKIKADVFVSDLSNLNELKTLCEGISTKGYKITYLINNAGFGLLGYFDDVPIDDQIRMINLNICALTCLTHYFIKDMKLANFGKILNVASTAAFQPGPLMSVYYSTKAFVLRLSEALAYELRNTKVTVTTLCPGPTKSNFQKNAGMDNLILFKISKIPSSYEVAEYGFKAMMVGKGVVVPGFINKITSFLVKFFPKKLVLFIVNYLQEHRQ